MTRVSGSSIFTSPILVGGSGRSSLTSIVCLNRFVEMLESHHSLVVKALQQLYKLCLNKEGFPGEPLVEAPDGFPLTHAILDRLGLIKQAEENPEEATEDSEDLQYLRLLLNSTDCGGTTDPSPEPATPPEPSSSNCSPVDISPTGTEWKWNFPPAQSVHSEQYQSFPDQQFSGMALSQSPLGPGVLSGESPCLNTSSTVLDHDHSYLYYLDGCNGVAKDSMNSHVSAGPDFHPAASAIGIPVDMLAGFDIHLQEHHHALHPPLIPGWTYPRG